MERKLRIAVAGLGFGAEFVPIYLAHPNVEAVGICDPNADVLAQVGERYGVERRFTNLDDVRSAGFDAVHLVTPMPLHAENAVESAYTAVASSCPVTMNTS